MKFWGERQPPVEVLAVRSDYQLALQQVRRAIAVSKSSRRAELQYLAGRLEFGLGYLDAAEAVAAAGAAERAGQPDAARKHAQQAQTALRVGLTAYAQIAVDQSDRGAIATLNEFAWRPLNRKLAELSK
jgi:hypothetical protein